MKKSERKEDIPDRYVSVYKAIRFFVAVKLSESVNFFVRTVDSLYDDWP